jgi:hypothetical protein
MTPLIRPTVEPVASEDGQRRRSVVPPDDRADHGAQRQVGADGQVDATGEDDEELAERQHGDDRRLLQHVADVLERQEHVRHDAQRRDEQHEDGDRAQPEGSERQREPAMRRAAVMAARTRRHGWPVACRGVRHRVHLLCHPVPPPATLCARQEVI